MSGRSTRSRAKAAEAGGASSSSAVSVTHAPDTQPPPAKRAKTQKAKNPAAQSRRKKGRLSVLPTLPLDVLFEIFGHLGPADLLHLARTTKSFRNVLMARQSAFLWKEVYDAVDEVENFPCPEEVSLLKWINLVYGGPFCDEVGCSGRASKVLWEINRRLCKSCQDKLLVSGDDVWDLVGAEVMLLLDALKEAVPRDTISRSGRLRVVYLRADIQTLTDEIFALAKKFDYPIQTLSYPPPKGSPEWETALASFKSNRKIMVDARHAHAEECSMKDAIRMNLRVDELDELKDARFLDVKQRLMAMGFDAADAGAGAIRAHREVKQPKLLTDRVWTRIGPLLRTEAERIRDERLARERRDRMTFRFAFARRRYEHVVLSTVAPSTVCFAPGHDVVFKLPRLATYLKEDGERSSESESEACATAFDEADVLALVNDWISRRQASLRTKLPDIWPRSSSTNEEIVAHWPTPTEHPTVDHYAQLADLDLAIYAFQCSVPTCTQDDRVFYGLDILAHDCLNHIEKDRFGHIANPDELGQPANFTLHATPMHDHHAAALRVVQLLELDPTKARPVDLDRANKFFTAEPRGPHSQGQPFLTWRQAVNAGAVWCKLDTIRLVTDREQTYLEKHHDVFEGQPLHPIDADPESWACTRCASIVDPADVGNDEERRWSNLADVRGHLMAIHAIEDAEEGQDYFYDRHRDRYSHRGRHGLKDNNDVFTHLPRSVDLDSAIAALDGMDGAFNPFSILNMMWPGGQGPPLWLADMMDDLLFSELSDSEDSMDL